MPPQQKNNRPAARKPVLIYVTANMVRGGGDQLLLTYVRAMQSVPCRLVLLSLEPINEDKSMIADFRESGVKVMNSEWVDRVLLPKLAPLIMPGVVLRAVLKSLSKSLALLRARPRSPGLVRALREDFQARVANLRARSLLQLRLFIFRRRLRWYVRFHPVKAVHIFHALACEVQAAFIRAKPVPIYYTEITSPDAYGGLAPDLSPILPLVDEIIVPSEGVAQRLQERCRLKKKPHVIPFAVRISPTPPPAAVSHPARQNYGSIGRLSIEKGHRYLLEAAARIEPRCAGARLILAGAGPLEQELKEQAQTLNLSRIDFLGAFPDLPAVMAELDVLVQPSLQEGMPLVLLEALAYGKPVVATPVGAVPEMIADGVNGFLVPAGDSEALANRVSELLLDPGLRARMGRQAQEIYRRCYNYEATLEKIRALYAPIIANGALGGENEMSNTPEYLVTGAGGFIGSHLTEALLRRGAEVRALIHYNSQGRWGHLDEIAPELKPRLHVVAGDVTDPYFVREAVAGCRVVFHLAALIGIPYSYQAPASYLAVNVGGTLNVLEACRQAPVERLLVTSTSEVYGTARYAPIDEAHPLQGQSPYSASKIAADKFAEAYFLSFDLPVVTVRPFNVYGPRQSLRAIIPTIAAQIAAGLPCIQLGSLWPQRDLTFVEDTVAGFLLLAECVGAIGQAVNLGSGQKITMGDLAGRMLKLSGRDIPIQATEERQRPAPSEVGLLLADANKAHHLTGWAPRVPLDEGLRRVMDYVAAHPAAYQKTGYQR